MKGGIKGKKEGFISIAGISVAMKMFLLNPLVDP